MKRILILCTFFLLTLPFQSAYSQKDISSPVKGLYQEIFDEHFGYSIGSSTSNSQITFAWNESRHLESLIIMYEATNDVKYLRMFIKAAGNVIDRRDDLRDQIGLDKIYDYRGISAATWSTNRYNNSSSSLPYAHIVHTGMITYPMAKFAYLVLNKTTSLQNEYSENGGRYSTMKFVDIANEMVARVSESIVAHDDQWHESGDKGWYEERCGSNVPINYNCMEVPFNYLSSFGRTILYIYKVTGSAVYKNKITKLTNFMKQYTHYDSSRDSYTWGYWEYVNGLLDNLSHGGLSVSFPIHCYETGEVYTLTDMKRYANTFSNGIYKEPMYLNGYVGIYSGGRDFHINYDIEGYYAQDWLPLAQYDKKIFHELSDIYIQQVWKKLNNCMASLEVAQLCKARQNFSPIAYQRFNNSDKKWAGVGAGNFDGDAGDEIIASQNSDGKLVLYDGAPSATGEMVVLDEFSSRELGKYWKSIGTGNFIGGREDDFIAINDNPDNTKNGFYIFSYNNIGSIEKNIKLENKFTGWGPASDWAGIVGGNFLNNRFDDFIAIRNFQYEVYVYKMANLNASCVKVNKLNFPAGTKIVSVASGNLDRDANDELILLVNSPNNTYCGYYIYDVLIDGSIQLLAKSTGWGAASDWKGLSVGDYDADGIDEFIVHRNFDGEYKIRKLQGTTITTLGFDYFPKEQTNGNLIVSGNFSVNSSNDEIVVFREFDGDVLMYEYKYLKSTLGTANENTLRPEMENEVKETETDVAFEIENIYPNPASNYIYINVRGNEEFSVTIYDMNGSQMLNARMTAEKSNLDISSLNPGMYLVNVSSGQYNKTTKLIKN